MILEREDPWHNSITTPTSRTATSHCATKIQSQLRAWVVWHKPDIYTQILTLTILLITLVSPHNNNLNRYTTNIELVDLDTEHYTLWHNNVEEPHRGLSLRFLRSRSLERRRLRRSSSDSDWLSDARFFLASVRIKSMTKFIICSHLYTRKS